MPDIPCGPFVGKTDSCLTSDRRVRISTIASRRRLMLERRYALEKQWSRLFPNHQFADLRLIRPMDVPGWPADQLDHWRASARAYHAERWKWSRR
jgi:hypothetical protein